MSDARKSAKQDAIGRRTADARTTRQEPEMIVGVTVLCRLNLSALLLKKKDFPVVTSAKPFRARRVFYVS